MNTQQTRLLVVLLLAALLVGGRPVLADTAAYPASDTPPTIVNCGAEHFLFTEDLVLASTGELLFRFTGTGWERVPVPGAWDQVRLGPNGVVYLYDAMSNNLYSSADGGQTWSPPQTTPFGTYDYETFYPAPIADMFFVSVSNYAGANAAGLWKSSDGGASWRRVFAGDGGWGTVDPLVFSPAFASNGTAFAAESGRDTFAGVLKSTDFGASWAPAENGMYVPVLAAYDPWLAISPDFATDGTIFSGGGNQNPGFYRSVNGGASWEYLAGIEPSFAAVSPDYAQDGRVLFAYPAYHSHGVYLSEAQGDAPVLVGDLPRPLVVGIRSLEGAPGAQEFWAVVQPEYPSCELYRSTDDGATWEGQVLFTLTPRSYLPLIFR